MPRPQLSITSAVNKSVKFVVDSLIRSPRSSDLVLTVFGPYAAGRSPDSPSSVCYSAPQAHSPVRRPMSEDLYLLSAARAPKLTS